MDFCTIDRKERTVYVTGMHPRCDENTIFDLFSRTGYVEKVVLHLTEEGNPHYCLVVYRDPESVMYTISQLNGHRLLGQSLNLRPLRESSHAAVLQRAITRRRNPLHQQQNIGWTNRNLSGGPINTGSIIPPPMSPPPQHHPIFSPGSPPAPQYYMGGGIGGVGHGYYGGFAGFGGGAYNGGWCNNNGVGGSSGRFWNPAAQPEMHQ